MNRLTAGVCAALLCAVQTVGTSEATNQRTMQFEWRIEAGAVDCGTSCRKLLFARGPIAADTARAFNDFAKAHDISGATLVLDSDGGSVLGALALGRAVRRHGLATTVGRLESQPPGNGGIARARVDPRARCESMCAFVLLGGVDRRVPSEAQVLVHQIWLGDRRDDPTSVTYSAEDLALVQRDIGLLAQYTVEMGAGIGLLETALRIPPWEPMRALSRSELQSMQILTVPDVPAVERANVNLISATSATASNGFVSHTRGPSRPLRWSVAERHGHPVLSRIHPLTVEGEDLGTFEVLLSCGVDRDHFSVTYIERRRVAGESGNPEALSQVAVLLGGQSHSLALTSSTPTGDRAFIDSVATASLPVSLWRSFAVVHGRSLTIETAGNGRPTNIRIGNAGAAQGLNQLAVGCGRRQVAQGGVQLGLGR